jgi:hypothetical protein
MLGRDLLIKRLAIIKLLYKIGIDQSRQSESVSYFAILTLHDSVEMFLRLAAEHVNVKADDLNFIQYWERIPELTLKESMRACNLRRVNLKHKGLIPAKIEVEASRVNAMDFFDQNTSRIFGIEFSDVSLIELVKFTKTKEYLTVSQFQLDANDIVKSIENATFSFNYLLQEYKGTKVDKWLRTHFSFTRSIRLSRYTSLSKGSEGIDRRLDEVVKEINDNFMQIDRGLEVLALGLDYRKYSKFRFLTPDVYRLTDGSFRLVNAKVRVTNKENCQFLIDFVLECALKLQEFDYEFEELEITAEPLN